MTAPFDEVILNDAPPHPVRRITDGPREADRTALERVRCFAKIVAAMEQE
ncbi:MAG: hypothetical protein OEW19_22865 [Acidobacteriota bacterium]|nr:hypothetical protein [Acidobacteriota bacterium]